MKIGKLDSKKNIIVIAEVGNNHEGSYTLAEELVGLAAEAGADAVKFQTFITENFIDSSDLVRYNKLKKFQLNENEFLKLSKVAKEQDIAFISTPLDLKSADFLLDIVDAIKIASGDNTFFPLIDKLALSNVPLILSTGMLEMDSVVKVKDRIIKIKLEHNNVTDLAVLHCVSSYPVEMNQANLNAIKTLTKKLNCDVGYSDHTNGILASIASAAIGARIIEKHFTIDNNFSDFRDHKLSANPGDLKKMIKSIRDVEKLLGSGKKIIQKCEEKDMKLMRRSISAKRSLQKNHKIVEDDLIWLRPGLGIQPGNENSIIGKLTNKKIQRGQNITTKDLKTN